MSSKTLTAAIEKKIRSLCLTDFPCGNGPWVSFHCPAQYPHFQVYATLMCLCDFALRDGPKMVQMKRKQSHQMSCWTCWGTQALHGCTMKPGALKLQSWGSWLWKNRSASARISYWVTLKQYESLAKMYVFQEMHRYILLWHVHQCKMNFKMTEGNTKWIQECWDLSKRFQQKYS